MSIEEIAQKAFLPVLLVLSMSFIMMFVVSSVVLVNVAGGRSFHWTLTNRWSPLSH